jgi:hypothetical protein
VGSRRPSKRDEYLLDLEDLMFYLKGRWSEACTSYASSYGQVPNTPADLDFRGDLQQLTPHFRPKAASLPREMPVRRGTADRDGGITVDDATLSADDLLEMLREFQSLGPTPGRPPDPKLQEYFKALCATSDCDARARAFIAKWKLPGECYERLFLALDHRPASWKRTLPLTPMILVGSVGAGEDVRRRFKDRVKTAEAEIGHWQKGVLQARENSGRPQWSGYWASEDDLRRTLQSAVVEIGKTGRRPTQEKVVSYFASRRDLPAPELSPRQLRHWVNNVLRYKNWDAFVRDALAASEQR